MIKTRRTRGCGQFRWIPGVLIFYSLSFLLLILLSSLWLSHPVFAGFNVKFYNFKKGLEVFKKEVKADVLPPDVFRERYPALFDILNEIVEKFTKVLNSPKHNGGESHRFLGLYLVDSETDLNATSHFVRDPEIPGAPFYVSLSTCFLNAMIPQLEGLSPEEKRKAISLALRRMIGTLAHEVAHQSAMHQAVPKDLIDYHFSRQYEEARADTLAFDLLSESQFPRSSVLEMLSRLQELKEGQEGILGALVSDHPSGEFRTALARQTVVVDRITHGSPPDVLFERAPDSIIPDLEKLEKDHKQSFLRSVENLDRATLDFQTERKKSTLTQLGDETMNHKTCDLFTQAEKFFFFLNQEDERTWTQAQSDQVEQIYGRFIETIVHHHANIVAEKVTSDRYGRSVKHYTLDELADVRLLKENCPKYLQLISSSSKKQLVGKSKALQSPAIWKPFLDSYSHFNSESSFMRSFIHLLDYIPNSIKAHAFIDQFKFNDNLWWRSNSSVFIDPAARTAVLTDVAMRLDRDITPESLRKSLYHMKMSQTSSDIFPVLALNGITEDWVNSLPLDSPIRSHLLKIANWVWKNRAIFAESDLVNFLRSAKGFGYDRVNWALILKLLNLRPDPAKAEIREALKDYYQTAPVQKLLTEHYVGSYGYSPLGDLEGAELLYWDGKDLGEFLEPIWSENTSSEMKTKSDSILNRGWVGLNSFREVLFDTYRSNLEKQKLIHPIEGPQPPARAFVDVWKQTYNGLVPLLAREKSGRFLLERPEFSPYFRRNDDFLISNPLYQWQLQLANWIDTEKFSSDLEENNEMKRKILREFLEDSSQNAEFRLDFRLKPVFALMRKYRVFSTNEEYFNYIYHFNTAYWNRLSRKIWEVSDDELRKKEEEKLQRMKENYLSQTYQEMDSNLAEEFKEYYEKNSKGENPEQVLEHFRVWLSPNDPEDRNKPFPNMPLSLSESLTQTKRKIVNHLLTITENPSQFINRFELLTATGSTLDTDRYLQKRLEQLNSPDHSSELDSKMEEWLVRRVMTESVKKDLGQKWLDAKIDKSHLQKISIEEIKRHVLKIFPNASLNRDGLLEHFAWKLNLTLPEIQEQIEPYKVGNDREKMAPWQVNVMSLLIEKMSNDDDSMKLDYIRYIIDPSSEESYQRVFYDLLSSTDSSGDPVKRQAAQDILFKIQTLHPYEKMSILEMILGSRGVKDRVALADEEKELKIEPLLSQYLNLPSGSKKAKMFNSYLKSVLPYERASVLAYSLSHSKEGGAGVSLKPLFEIFTTVGIKTGQLAGIFNLFGPDAKKELDELKDQAQPMTKGDLLRTLQAQLPPEFYSKIKNVNRILGSASIKTVVELEMQPTAQYPHGFQVVAMVRRPYAIDLVHENLNRARAFIDALEKSGGFAKEVQSLKPLIQIVDLELQEELNFQLELNKVNQAGRLYGTQQKPFAVEIHSESGASNQRRWTFQVPQSVLGNQVHPLENRGEAGRLPGNPQILIMEKAPGVSLDHVLEPARSEAGEAIVTVCLDGLFNDCFMNADPHKGNFLVNSTTGTIYPIDFGQAENLSRGEGPAEPDERYYIAQFLIAVNKNNPDGVLRNGRNFIDPKDFSESRFQKLEILLRNLLKASSDTTNTASNDALFLNVINAFHEAGLPIKKSIFGILKGIAVLQHEEYVPPRKFNQMLSMEPARSSIPMPS